MRAVVPQAGGQGLAGDEETVGTVSGDGGIAGIIVGVHTTDVAPGYVRREESVGNQLAARWKQCGSGGRSRQPDQGGTGAVALHRDTGRKVYDATPDGDGEARDYDLRVSS